MKNTMHFENGIEHEFTAEEMKMLKICIAVMANDNAMLKNSIARVEPNGIYHWKYTTAMKQLYNLFFDHLD